MADGIARMGEVVFASSALSSLRALGLGSCIGLCAFDPLTKDACLAHIVLPQSKPTDTNPGKFADTAVPYALKELIARGAAKSRLRFAIAGGAQLFTLGSANGHLDIGKRNAEAVLEQIKNLNLRLVANDIGGKFGRTLYLNALSGEVVVKTVGGEEKLLVNLSR